MEIIREIFLDSVFRDRSADESEESEINKDGELLTDANSIIVDGILPIQYGFHKERLESHREDVKVLIDGLPFENTVWFGDLVPPIIDKDENNNDYNNFYTEKHRNIEMLLCMGVGLGFVEFNPRPEWIEDMPEVRRI